MVAKMHFNDILVDSNILLVRRKRQCRNICVVHRASHLTSHTKTRFAPYICNSIFQHEISRQRHRFVFLFMCSLCTKNDDCTDEG